MGFFEMDAKIRVFAIEARNIAENDIKHYLLENNPSLYNRLKQKENFIYQFERSLDVIEDVCLAIESYVEQQIPDDNKEQLYLMIYGLLQAIYAQQDSVDNLCEALEIRGKLFRQEKRCNAIRNIRNDCVGHPSNSSQLSKNRRRCLSKNPNEPHSSYYGITRISLSQSSFEYSSDKYKNGKYEYGLPVEVDLNERLGQYLDALCKKLKSISKEIKC